MKTGQALTFFPCGSHEKTVFPDFMKIPYLPIIVAAGALSLVSANAMPDLGRETGKFVRKDQSVPKDVKTFEPTRANASKAENASKDDLAILVPLRHPGPSKDGLALLVPLRHPSPSKDGLALLVPLRHPGPSKDDLALLVPLRHPGPSKDDLAILVPLRHPKGSAA
jgi:hypothetical protein